MERDITYFVAKCLTCEKIKFKYKKPTRLLYPLEIPEWKWDNITMDFVMELLRVASGNDAICIIVDRLTNLAHFLAIKATYSLDRLA